MRILFVSQEYPPESAWGGIGSYVACIAPALAARGHEVHVLSCVAGQASRDYTDRGVQIHRRGLYHFRGLSRLGSLFRDALGAYHTWDRLRLGLANFVECRRLGTSFDVVEVAAWNAEGWVFALLGTRPLVTSLVTTLSLMWACTGEPLVRDVRWSSRLERITADRAHAVISASELCSNSLKANGWLKRSSIEIVPFPVDWTIWETGIPVSETTPTVLFVGRLERRKAPEVLVDAISVIRKKVPNAQAIFIGNSNGERDGLPYEDWLVQRSNGDGGLQFLGSVARDQIVKCLGMSRVLAMPSISESFGLVAAEAMAAGRPVVTTTSSGITELVLQSRAGSSVPPGDAKALAGALLPFLEDAPYAAEVGARGRAAVRQLLDPAAVAEQREAVYAKAIAAHRLA